VFIRSGGHISLVRRSDSVGGYLPLQYFTATIPSLRFHPYLSAMIQTSAYPIHFDDLRTSGISQLIEKNARNAKRIILTDANTHRLCLPKLMNCIKALQDASVIQVHEGENHKNIDTCSKVWETLIALEADRNAILINLGGGVITDMGGFIAGTYKRGIKYINIPTTLLSQVDASVGSKVAVDLKNLKNQIGLFYDPLAVYIDAGFLSTLSKREMINGYAEMLKHAILDSDEHLAEIMMFPLHDLSILNDLVRRSVEFKHQVVQADPLEKGVRKILNFGHTVGHALETFSMENDRKQLKHGEAIAIGMICELHLSHEVLRFPIRKIEQISEFIMGVYPKFQYERTDIPRIVQLMRSDKKNAEGKINFSLLHNIGRPSFDHFSNGVQIEKALQFYLDLTR
jgi:3-dehydroquinate synthase